MEKLMILRKAFELFFDDSESDEDEDEDDASSESEQENNVDEIMPKFGSRTFLEHFRIEPDVFETICKDLHNHLPKKYGPGRNNLPIDKQLMIALWYLGNRDGLKSVAARFNVCKTTTWRIVTSVCDALIKINKIKNIIRWPTPAEAVETTNFNQAEYVMSDVIGYIDSCHIDIRTPANSNHSYKNKQGKHSVLLLGVCNEKMEFMFCYTGECGSIANLSLFVRSKLENKIETGYFNMATEQILLADRTFPIKSWLITPFLDNGLLTNEQMEFQMLHYKCRQPIRRAFSLLKGRFQRLQFVDSLRPGAIVKFIIACCILHNICLQHGDFADELNIKFFEHEKEVVAEDQDVNLASEYAESEANSKRERLLESIKNYMKADSGADSCGSCEEN